MGKRSSCASFGRLQCECCDNSGTFNLVKSLTPQSMSTRDSQGIGSMHHSMIIYSKVVHLILSAYGVIDVDPWLHALGYKVQRVKTVGMDRFVNGEIGYAYCVMAIAHCCFRNSKFLPLITSLTSIARLCNAGHRII